MILDAQSASSGPAGTGFGLSSLVKRVRYGHSMIGPSAKGILLAAILLIAGYSNIYAAAIREINNKLCAFSVEGTILLGDYDELFKMLRHNIEQIHDLDERTRTICLKSAGGSYDEALKIRSRLQPRTFNAYRPWVAMSVRLRHHFHGRR
jgi:hypothetical protein